MQLSYAAILARSGPLSVADASTLVLAAADALLEQYARQPDGGCPGLEDILLNSGGRVTLAARCERDDEADVGRLADMLRQFLVDGDTTVASRSAIPGALLLLTARALRGIDLPVPALMEFSSTLARFGSADAETLGLLYRRCMRIDAPGSDTSVAAIPLLTRASASAGTAVRRTAPSMPTVPAVLQAKQSRRVAWRPLGMARRGATVAALVAGGAIGAGGLFLLIEPAPTPGEAVQDVKPSQPAPSAELAGARAANTPAPDAAAHRLRAARQPATPVVAGNARVRQRGQGASALLAATDVGVDVFSPSFIHTGGALLFHAGRTRGALMQASFDQHGRPTVVPIIQDDAATFHGSMSLDGQWLAFDSDRDGTRGVYVARPNGSAAEKVSGDGYALAPRWSPDGRMLAFVKAEADRPRVWNVWTVALQTQALSQISRHAVGQAWGPSWFPDGVRLAYSVEDTLVIVDVRSGASRVLRSPVRGRLVRTPAVSPDGQRIVFQVFRDGVWVLQVGTGRMMRVLDDTTAEEFAWTPAGDAVAYHTKRRGAWSLWQLPLAPATS